MSIIEITINKELDDSAKVELKALGFISIRKIAFLVAIQL